MIIVHDRQKAYRPNIQHGNSCPMLIFKEERQMYGAVYLAMKLNVLAPFNHCWYINS